MLEIRGVTKAYVVAGVRRIVLDKVGINFRTSEFAAILGPSGSGKTTLLNIIGGLDHYDSGDLIINEKSTKKFRDKDWDSYRNHRIGFVFQSYNLIPHQTVLQNVRLALTLSGISKRESIRRAKKALKDVGLEDHIHKKPSQLSGGQMQRVAIARALVNDPDILLADEPTGALDSETSIQIMTLLKEIAQDKLVIMVTHNPELAEEYATRIITLKDGKITSDSNPYDGKIKTDLDLEKTSQKQRKTRMSFLTALSLSLKNLLTKKGRTILVALAGSIGIIGIALISAVSNGFQNYIDSIEHDTLTSYPLALRSESTDVTGLLLSVTGDGDNGIEETERKVRENQVLTSALGNVTNNDLKSFRQYLDSHYDEVKDDLRLIENEYSVNPLIYTIDASGELAKLNPSNLFTSLIGDSSILSSYSSLTSIYAQYAPENLKADTEVLAGRLPEKYNEMAIFLSKPTQISDLLAYSLGFHDTKELTNIVKSVMSGEKVDINNDPLELTYDELMSVDLRLIAPSDTYKYNEKYGVYEDMSEDIEYMRNLYNQKAERLKIVGIITAKPGTMMVSGSGIVYLPSLVEHIIQEAGETEIVKKQLATPEVDIFSNRKFGETENDFGFEFSDLVSVDQSKLAGAIGVNIDKTAIQTVTAEYMTKIANEITTDTEPARTALLEKLQELGTNLAADTTTSFTTDEIDKMVDDFMQNQDIRPLLDQYVNLTGGFADVYGGILSGLDAAYRGLLKGALATYVATYQLMNPGTQDIMIDQSLFETVFTDYKEHTAVTSVVDELATLLTETSIKQKVLAKVTNLVSYISESFANAFSINQDALLSAFRLNFSEDELARVVNAMFNKKETTLFSNLVSLGYQKLDEPTEMAFYFTSFDGKTHFVEFLDNYNESMRSYHQDAKVIEYNDTTGILMESVKTIVDAVSYVLIAFVSISLVVSSIMIGVITYISVYERTKEIGILRAIGASKHNISSIFNAETFIIGLLSGILAIVVSYLIIPVINLILHNFTGDIPLSAALAPQTALFLIILSIALTLIGGLIPARSASKKDPVEALRSE